MTATERLARARRRAARMRRLVKACGGDQQQAKRVYDDLKRLGAHP